MNKQGPKKFNRKEFNKLPEDEKEKLRNFNICWKKIINFLLLDIKLFTERLMLDRTEDEKHERQARQDGGWNTKLDRTEDKKHAIQNGRLKTKLDRTEDKKPSWAGWKMKYQASQDKTKLYRTEG